MGVVFSLLGRLVNPGDPELEEAKLKGAIKEFQYAGWIFDKIRQDMPNKVTSKELSPDMSNQYLSYVSKIEFKAFSLILAIGTCETFESALISLNLPLTFFTCLEHKL